MVVRGFQISVRGLKIFCSHACYLSNCSINDFLFLTPLISVITECISISGKRCSGSSFPDKACKLDGFLAQC